MVLKSLKVTITINILYDNKCSINSRCIQYDLKHTLPQSLKAFHQLVKTFPQLVKILVLC